MFGEVLFALLSVCCAKGCTEVYLDCMHDLHQAQPSMAVEDRFITCHKKLYYEGVLRQNLKNAEFPKRGKEL